MALPKLKTDGPNIISAERGDRVMVAVATTHDQAAQIVRAANTFEQAKAALKLSLEYYRAKATRKFNPYDVERSLEQALAAMEDRA